ncbi:hypothetical protein CAPTEDRAFT_215520 [Capitella teleta]|uniref:Fibronectin type-III domain-containing protein n=1 Tax=Capitella teleta TaxID=283909 RepID=R7V821_CAPTE|nr:hypothetical protein CAPTEDRAFT_215520 [Capitella teleta]|eukprot:ELU14647.1 hypothetical protein CAPTEDRAFT_215520 [Capitella teleta]
MSSQRYTITLTTFLNDVESRQLSITFYTNSDAPTNIRILSRTETGITFIWSPPANPGKVDDYEYYLQSSSDLVTTSFYNFGSDIREHSRSLDAGRTYIIVVRAYAYYQYGMPASLRFTMKPKPVLNLEAEVYPGGLILSWISGFGSFENSYRYQYVGRITKLDSVPWEITTSKRVKLEHLFPGEMYEFYVEAIANGKHSLYNRSVIATTLPLPPLGLTIDIAETTESSLLILWEDDETRSYITSWDVEIADIGTYRPKAVGSTSDRTVLNYEITNLISGKNYTAYVFGKSGDQRSHQAATVDLTLSEFRALKF